MGQKACGTQSSTEEGYVSPLLLGREQDAYTTAAPQPSLDTDHCSECQMPQEFFGLFLLTNKQHPDFSVGDN